MIRLYKTPEPPPSLTGPAVAAAKAALEQAYDADPSGCQRPGVPALKPSRRFYAAPDVKRQLKADQHNKCAYCETCFVHSSSGDVEHYRPKAGYRQAVASPLQGPGYYWLAYNWHNLLFACEDCNRIRKRQLFPLRNDPAGRARSHHDEPMQEDPLLLNPAVDPDPESHITFDGEVAKGLTPEGIASLEGYGLNRIDLLNDRNDRLRAFRSEEVLARLYELDPPATDLGRLVHHYGSEEALSWHIAQARQAYQHATLDAAEYAGMVRAYLHH